MAIQTDAETLHVFAVDLSMPKATEFACDPDALSRALGGIEVEIARVEILDPRALGDLGLSSYLAEGEGVTKENLRDDAPRLDAVTDPVLVLRPRGISESPRPQEPLRHLGSYRLDRGTPPEMQLRAASAETAATGVPPAAPAPGTQDRKSGGVVAIAALAAALLVAFIVWYVAT